jgi:hypothetical protein
MTLQTFLSILPNYLIHHLPIAVVAFVAWYSLYQRREQHPIAAKWAMVGFALAGFQTFLGLLSQLLVVFIVQNISTSDAAHHYNTTHFLYIAQNLFWSIFQVAIYVCLLQAFKQLLPGRAA